MIKTDKNKIILILTFILVFIITIISSVLITNKYNQKNINFFDEKLKCEKLFDDMGGYKFEGVIFFYSPKLNTCLIGKQAKDNYGIMDLLERKILFSTKNEEEYIEKINEFKEIN